MSEDSNQIYCKRSVDMNLSIMSNFGFIMLPFKGFI
jgi:hypothetical protein